VFHDLHSLERIKAYLDIEHEPKNTEGGAPPAYWPASGEIRVEKLSARYSLVSLYVSTCISLFDFDYRMVPRSLMTYLSLLSLGSASVLVSHSRLSYTLPLTGNLSSRPYW
jgi:hypothetical protein